MNNFATIGAQLASLKQRMQPEPSAADIARVLRMLAAMGVKA